MIYLIDRQDLRREARGAAPVDFFRTDGFLDHVAASKGRP